MRTPSKNTGKKRGKRSELEAWLELARPEQIGEAGFDELSRALSPVSPSYLRKLLRESGVALAPMVEGVRQTTFEELETTLLRLFKEYEGGNGARRALIRRMVIEAKDHARWAAGRKPEKEEMVLWMVTWLENPPVFPQWVRLRRKNQEEGSGEFGNPNESA